MGTTWEVRYVAAPGHALQRLHEGIQARLDEIVSRMSHWESDSDLSRFNRSPAGTRWPVPAALEQVLGCAMSIARDSDGAFDVTAGALVDVWGFGPGAAFRLPGFEPPGEAILAAAMQSSGWRRLQPDPLTRSMVQPGGLQLDLSAIAKGFGVDQVALQLQAEGISSYLVEVGGELRGAGVKPDGQPWWVALEPPDEDCAAGAGAAPSDTIVALHDLSIATSGDYRRFFDSGGARYCHTIDLRTGRPVTHGVASVTVLHAQCMVADALSTALMVMGADEGIAWADRRGVAALFCLREGAGGGSAPATPAAPAAPAGRITERITKGFAELLET